MNSIRYSDRRRFLTVLVRILTASSAFTYAGFGQNVLTQHYDIGRTGQNVDETTLNPTNVKSSTFGKLFSVPVTGYVYAQPLYMANLTIPGRGQHNVVFIATEHDSVYAFDADTNGGANAIPLWQVSLLDAAHGAGPGATTEPSSNVSAADISPEIGITSTPVIDPNTGTMYVVGQTIENGIAIQRLHALDVTSGAEKFNGPVALQASVPGTGNGSSGGVLQFDPQWANNRAGLLLLNGIVYLAFGSHGDNGPWHGWILAYNATTLARTGAMCTSPNGVGDGIWMAGSGIAAEVVDPINAPFGRMFVATGNGSYNATIPYTNTMDYGDDHIRLDLTNGVPTVSNAFTPYNQQQLSASDLDVASGGILLLPDQTTGGHRRLLVQAGKQGTIYLVDRDNMGDFGASDNIVQEITGQIKGLWSMPAYWNNNIYVWGNSDHLKAFSLANGLLSSVPTSVSAETSLFPGSTAVVSANGNTNGIVWNIQSDAYNTNGPAILLAHDATNVATTLYSSNQNLTRDTPGSAVKFAVPLVIKGKVYVGAQNEFSVYGLFNGEQKAAVPVISPAAAWFSASITVSISDTTPGATIFYTTDGTIPTEASTVYSGPFTVSSTTTTVNALASATGYLQSPVASALYTSATQVATPVLSVGTGTYATPQSVTISDITPNSVIYYTLDGTTPTTSSRVYSGAISVSSNLTLKAIAAASGLANSAIVTAIYSIQIGATISFPNGFSSAPSSMTLNGSATLDDSRLQLTTGGANQAGSAFYNAPVNIQRFVNDFTFQLSNPSGDGFTFAIQGNGPTALGTKGGGLGYGAGQVGGTGGIVKSVAIKFDLFGNAGEGSDSTGLYTNGAAPTLPSVDLSKTGINLHSGDTMSVHMTYDGATLTMTITDAVVKATYSVSWTVNIPAIVGGNTAYVGFTGGTGNFTASQKIETWVYANLSQVAAPVISPAPGSYLMPLSVTLTDATPGATIFYTTNGTVPTKSSTVYTGSFQVTSSGTVQALATASGYAQSQVASTTYTSVAQAATPMFSPAPGQYTSTQSVTISDTTPNAVIHYTLNGTTPTASSPVYGGPISVSSSVTIQAIAIASGFTNSTIGTAAYSIQTAGAGINFGTGFSTAPGRVTFNESAALNGSSLQLTNGGTNQVGSAFYNSAVNVQTFINDFTFQLSNATADGFTFTIQGSKPTALGTGGGGLGYGGIGNSLAVKFDLHGNSGEGNDSTGLYTNGATPTVPAVDLSGTRINLHSGDVITVHMTYDSATLTMTISDATVGATYTTSWSVNIPALVGANTAYVGFTGSSGGLTANQNIQTWTYVGIGTGINYGSGFSTAQNSLTFNGSAVLNGSWLQLTNGGSNQAGSVFYNNTVNVQTFTSDFSFQVLNPTGDGLTFTIQGNKPTALGASGGGLGYATIGKSVAVKFDLYSNGGEGRNSTGIYTNGAQPTLPSTTLVNSGIDLHSGHVMSVHMTYDGATLIMTITDASASAVYTTSWPVNIPSLVGANTAYVGFTGGTGGLTSTQDIQAWTYSGAPPQAPPPVKAAPPMFSPVAGAYTTAQSVTITDDTQNAVIYYTLDGTTPTTSSLVYTGPISVSANETIEALGVASGFANSVIATAVYSIQPSGTGVNFGNGFSSASSSMTFNGSTALNGSWLQLTNGGSNEVGSAFSKSTVNVQTFTNDFTFQLSNASGDGFTFTIQGKAPTALGTAGGGLGYATIKNSMAVKFDLYSNAGEGNNSTGLYTNGVAPTLPSIDLSTSGINLHSGDTMSVHMTYDGTTLTMTLTDAVSDTAYTTSWPINIPALVGANTAYVGFTGGSGGATANQNIKTWTYVGVAR